MRSALYLAAFTLITSPILLTGCSTTSGTGVQQFGEMRAVMRQGDTAARITLVDAAQSPGAIAVGALAGLEGEVTIVDGQVWVARFNGSEVQVTGPKPVEGESATLLTHAVVDAWHETKLDLSAATGGSELEAVIERAASAAGIDTSIPFPFVINADAAQLELHVINGFCPMGSDPAELDAEPWRWSAAETTPATIVGFYAPDAAGVMTHHGTSVHLHALITQDSETITGHIENLTINPGATIRLPASP